MTTATAGRIMAKNRVAAVASASIWEMSDNMRTNILVVGLLCMATLPCCATGDGTSPQGVVPNVAAASSSAKPYEIVRGAEVDADGVISYFLRSPFMNGESRVRILHPARKTDRLLFVLPVTPWPGFRAYWRKHGDGLAEVKKHDYHNQYGYTVIAPDFPEHMPWFVDHATDPKRRHESYMMQVLIPFVDDVLKTKQPVRDLVGFSKSAYGSLHLLLRHPDAFHACSIWDPGGITRPYDPTIPTSLSDASGSASQFEQYHIKNAITPNAHAFRGQQRIAISGYSNENFKNNLTALHQLLVQADIPHAYNDTVNVKHHWFTGWLDQAMVSLDTMK